MVSNLQYANIGSDNILSPNRCQVTAWTIDDPVPWCIYVIRPQWVNILDH